MNAAELFVKCLENEGVTHVFGVPGEENEDLLFALEKSSIEFVPTRHEQGAAFIANVIGRLTGKPGICLSTLGPGATNLITGVADAYLDKAPLVAITAQASLDRMHLESHQLIDIKAMMQSITKWNSSIIDPENIPETIRKGFKLAQIEKPGPVHIEFPEDIAGKDVNNSLFPLRLNNYRRPSPDMKSIHKVAQIINQSERCIVIAGNGAIRNRASRALCAFSNKTNIPVASTFMGKGAITDKDRKSLGTIGLGFKDYIIEAFETADTIITVGYDIAEYDPKSWNIGNDKEIIHIDFEYAEVYNEYVPQVEIVADLANSLDLLTEQVEGKKSDWYVPFRERVLASVNKFKLPDESTEFDAPGIIHATREILADDGLLISDVGSHKMWIARNFPTYISNGCIISNGLASMGISLPGGIAAKSIDPQREVVCIMGDGGSLMNIQELETAKRMGVGYTIIILNDNNYGLIEWKQKRSTIHTTGTKISNPDFVRLAESFGMKGYKPKSIKEFKETLSHTLLTHEMAIIEVDINTNVNEELIDELKNYYQNTKK